MGYAQVQVPPYDARAVANYFLGLAERDLRPIDPLKVQKLVYLAHGWSLVLLNTPLITDRIEAREYGPVIRSIYDAFADIGNRPIDHPAYASQRSGSGMILLPVILEDPLPEPVRELLEEVWRVYSPLSAVQLSNYTHQDGSPWEKAWHRRSPFQKFINNGLIKDYFSQLAASNVRS